MVQSEIINSARSYVINYIQQRADKVQLPYHNLDHTEKVVAAVYQIAHHYQLNEQDEMVVVVAGWFHDLGYYDGGRIGHEAKGAELATAFLKEREADDNTIAEVNGCIMATQMPQNPQTLLQKIECDADLFHLGTDDFTDCNKRMRKEFELVIQKEVDKKVWRSKAVELFQMHHYHTDYCQALLNEKKQANLEKLIKKNMESSQAGVEQTNDSDEQNSSGGKKAEKPSRGIETMFRVTVTNQQRLSDMADSKANIMISVNAIIISVVIGFVGRKLDSTGEILLPTIGLLMGCVTAIIFAVLATRPKIPGGYFTQEQLDTQQVNLLFFGNFYMMEYEQYHDGMKKVMADKDFLYGSLIRDIHSQGKVLGRKYKQLRISYTVFMFTLIISVIAFAITFLFFDKLL